MLYHNSIINNKYITFDVKSISFLQIFEYPDKVSHIYDINTPG